MNNYIVYQHINPDNAEVFYIGSGKSGREHETGLIQRGALYNLYIKNNGLESFLGLHRKIIIAVNILARFNNKAAAMRYECELINKVYGLDGYKLVNTQTSFILNETMLNNRTKAVKEAVSKKVKNRNSNITFNSITDMAKAYDFERSRLMHRLTKISLYPCHNYNDGINPIYC